MKYFNLILFFCISSTMLSGMEVEVNNQVDHPIIEFPTEVIIGFIAAADIPTKNTMRGVCKKWKEYSSKNNLAIYRYPFVTLNSRIENYALQYALYQRDIVTTKCLKKMRSLNDLIYLSQYKDPFNRNFDIGFFQPHYFNASVFGDIDFLKDYCLDKERSINFCTENGESALYFAAWYGHEKCVQLLLGQTDVKNVIETKNTDCSPLIAATKNGNFFIVQLLLDYLKAHHSELLSRLMPRCFEVASKCKNISMVEFLFHTNKDKATSKIIKDCCCVAFEQNNIPLLSSLLDNTEDISQLFDIPDDTQKESLAERITRYHEKDKDIVMFFINYLLDKKLYNPHKDPISAVCLGVKMENLSLVSKILDYAKNCKKCFEQKDNHGYTPLCLAMTNEQENIFELLYQRGASISFCCGGGSNPLSIACKKGRIDVIKKLLKDIPDLTKTKGINPLFVAIEHGFTDIMTLLLEYTPALINRCSIKSKTSPLHVAVQKNNIAAVKILLNLPDINTNIRDKHGKTPLNYAHKNNNEEIIQLLQT